jgi:hypothetical protein
MKEKVIFVYLPHGMYLVRSCIIEICENLKKLLR